MTDLTEISKESKFAEKIREYFVVNKPEKIIETGLYHGKGSTAVIASLIHEIPITHACFFSIECNPENIDIATKNLLKNHLANHVSIMSGLSIPKRMMPTEWELKSRIHQAKNEGGIKMDHEQNLDGSFYFYQKEVEGFQQEDLLGWILNNWNYCPDFILLDSAGHLGRIEFEYVISQIKCPCAIALDDTRHFKHYESRMAILNDKRFEVICDEEEKFGFMIAKFHP